MGTSGIVRDMQKRLEANHALKKAKRQQKMDMRSKMVSVGAGSDRVYTYAEASPELLEQIQVQAMMDRKRDRMLLVYRMAVAMALLLGLLLGGPHLWGFIVQILQMG